MQVKRKGLDVRSKPFCSSSDVKTKKKLLRSLTCMPDIKKTKAKASPMSSNGQTKNHPKSLIDCKTLIIFSVFCMILSFLGIKLRSSSNITIKLTSSLKTLKKLHRSRLTFLRLKIHFLQEKIHNFEKKIRYLEDWPKRQYKTISVKSAPRQTNYQMNYSCPNKILNLWYNTAQRTIVEKKSNLKSIVFLTVLIVLLFISSFIWTTKTLGTQKEKLEHVKYIPNKNLDSNPKLNPYQPKIRKDVDTIYFNYWNCQYLNTSCYSRYHLKKSILQYRSPDFICINESNIIPKFPKYKTYFSMVKTPTGREKCNSSILIKDDIPQTKPNFSLDDNLTYTKILTKNSYIHIICVYGDNNTLRKNETLDKLIILVNKIRCTESVPKIIVIGDFNINIREIKKVKNKSFKSLLKLLKYHKLHSFTCERTNRNGERTRSRIDHLLSNNLAVQTKILIKTQERGLSDHLGFTGSISGIFKTKRFITKSPNRKIYKEITKEILNTKNPTLFDYKRIVKLFTNKLMTFRKTKVRISKRLNNILNSDMNVSEMSKAIAENFSNTIKTIGDLRFSKKCKQAFSLMKIICKYNLFEKSGGSIVNVVKKSGKTLCKQESSKAIIDHYREAHLDPDTPLIPNYNSEFPDLPKLSRNVLKRHLSNFSKEKGLGIDGFEDRIFKIHDRCGLPNRRACEYCKKKIDFAEKIWNKDYWNSQVISPHFSSRLIALNKDHPNIPHVSRYRPIVVMSPLIKLLELYLKDKLMNYNCNDAVKDQVGFIKNMSTSTNLFKLGSLMHSNWKKRKGAKPMYFFFIDFKSAFDSISRKKLYEVLLEEQILTDQEVQLLKFIHSRLTVSLGKNTCEIARGVPQGSTISPLLFNIYINSLLKKYKENMLSSSKLLAYADDILIVSYSISEIKDLIRITKVWCAENKMTLNNQKSGILIFRDKLKISQENKEILGIPIVTQYKYLGVLLNNSLNLDDHFKKLKKK